MPHNFIASLLVLRLWEIVSSDSPFPFSMPPLVLQTWFYFPIHSSHSFLKLKNSSILSLSFHRRTMQPNTFISIIHSGIFANGKKKKNLRWVRGRYELGKMREIFLTLVPMTTLPIALLRPVIECEDAVSFQLHFSLLSHFLCIFFFLGFPKSIQPGYKISVLKFRMSWDHTFSTPSWHSCYNKTRKRKQGTHNIWKITLTITQSSVSGCLELQSEQKSKGQDAGGCFPVRLCLSPRPQLGQMWRENNASGNSIPLPCHLKKYSLCSALACFVQQRETQLNVLTFTLFCTETIQSLRKK